MALIMLWLVNRSNNCGIPKQCQSCDDHCAKKDGKRGKHDYKEKSRLTITFVIVVDLALR